MSNLSRSLSHLPADVVHVNPPLDIYPALGILLEAPGLTDVNFTDLRHLARQIAEDRLAFAASVIRTMFSVAPAPANQLRAHNGQQNWTSPVRDIPILTSHTEVPMPVSQSEREPSWTKYELEAVKSLREVEKLTSLDRDTLVRIYPDFLVKLSPKRLGMKFRNVLKIMNGDAAAA